MNINPAQLRRLQTLYSQFERHTLDVDAGREARLEWAAERIGRKIASFSDLTIDEGKRLIDVLQGTMGVKAPSKTPRKRRDRLGAQKAGTEGRRDQVHQQITMVTPEVLGLIQRQLDRLGWDQAGLERFLLGARSPLKGRAQIRTLGDGNRVYWALKHIPVRKEQLAS